MTRTELLKISKPILFNTDMVKAILDGRKTVTRRVLKVPSKYKNIPSVTARIVNTNGEIVTYTKGQPAPIIIPPPHQVGDVLYVRETWHKMYRKDDYIYRADNPKLPFGGVTWRPSIHMSKSAARIFLKVTDVRVEKVHDITREQAIKEGFNSENEFMREFFKAYPKQHLDWFFNDEDLWVWVYEFEREENNGQQKNMQV